MNIHEFKKIIIESSIEDWTFDEDMGRYVYLNDLSITMKRVDEPEFDFDEDWIKNFIHHPTATRLIVELCYNGVAVERFFTASVDEYRMHIPYPNHKDLTITNEQYCIGRKINLLECSQIDSYDDYLKRAGIKVR